MSAMSKGMRILLLLGRERSYGIAALMLATVLTVTLVSPQFLSLGNIKDLLVQAAPVAMIACGVMMVVLTGEIDISVGSMMGLLAAVLGVLSSPSHFGWPVPVACVAVVFLGAGLGALNGVLVAFGRVPSIIVTLGMLTLLKGVTEIVLGGEWVTDLPDPLRVLGTGAVAGVPISVVTAGVVIVITGAVLNLTAFGRRVYAVGSNQEAARYAGIPVRAIKLLTFLWTGVLVGLAVLVSAPQLSVIDSGFGHGAELVVVTCVVVGGVAISGGVGTLSGVVTASVLMTMISTVLIFLKLGEDATYWSRAIQGFFILAAVLLDHVVRQTEASSAGGAV